MLSITQQACLNSWIPFDLGLFIIICLCINCLIIRVCDNLWSICFQCIVGRFKAMGLVGTVKWMIRVGLTLRSQQEDPMKGPSRFNLCLNPTRRATRGGRLPTNRFHLDYKRLKLSLSYDIVHCIQIVFRPLRFFTFCCSLMLKCVLTQL